jgi:hypothetical protein
MNDVKQALEMKPCPFCGHPPQVSPRNPAQEGDAWTMIACKNLDCQADVSITVHADDTHREEAARLWNHRPAPAQKED